MDGCCVTKVDDLRYRPPPSIAAVFPAKTHQSS
jgi:hypothetical protein